MAAALHSSQWALWYCTVVECLIRRIHSLLLGAGSRMTNNLERRQSPRKRFENLLYVEVEPGNGGMVLNFSEHGFGFRAVKLGRPKIDVKFAFTLNQKRRVGEYGRSEWSDKEGRVAGVQFTDVSDEFLGEMRSWMANAVEYPMQNEGSSSIRPASSFVPGTGSAT